MESNEKKEEKKGGFAWWWLLLPIAAFGVWWFFLRNNSGAEAIAPAVSGAEIKVCSMYQVPAEGHCCLAEPSQISLFNDGAAMGVSVNFPNPIAADALVKAAVLWPSGEVYPTIPINLTKDTSTPNGCYWAMFNPLHGIKWTVGKYRIQVQVGDKVVGEKGFEIVR